MVTPVTTGSGELAIVKLMLYSFVVVPSSAVTVRVAVTLPSERVTPALEVMDAPL